MAEAIVVSEPISKRRRPRAAFGKDMSISFDPKPLKQEELEPLLDQLGLSDPGQRQAVRQKLEYLAAILKGSRLQRDQSPTRSDARQTLRKVGQLACDLRIRLAAVPFETARCLDSQFDRGVLIFDNDVRADPLMALDMILSELVLACATTSNRLSDSDTSGSSLLKKIENHTEMMAIKMHALPLHVAWPLVVIEQYLPLLSQGPEEVAASDYIQQTLRRLEIISRVALRTENLSKGPQRDVCQSVIVKSLAIIFEQATGTKASHTATSKRHYGGEALSRFGAFALAFLELANPGDKRKRGRIEAISDAVWACRARGLVSNSQAQCDRWNRQLRAIMAAEASVTYFSHHL